MDHARGGKSTTAAVFAAQYGVIQRRQALQAGLTPRMIECLMSRGEWVAIHRGVYRIAGAPVTWNLRLMAACLAAGPGAVASHRSAAALWGLDTDAPTVPEIAVATSGARELRSVTVHHTRSLGPSDRATRDGIPCSSVARTLVDLASVLDEISLEQTVDSALREHLTSVGYLHRHVERLRDGRRGTGLLRELLVARTGERPYESRKEAELARLLVAAGLPKPVPQFELRVGGRLLARFDLAWPDAQVAVEFQSYRHHFGRQAWRRDVARANRAMAAGWIVFMATEEDVRDGARRLVADIGRACAA